MTDKLFWEEGYSHTSIIENQINKIITTFWLDILELKPKRKLDTIPIVTTYSNFFPLLPQITKNR